MRWKRRLSVTTLPMGRPREAFRFPLTPPARVAILDERFVPERSFRCFAPDEHDDMYRWAPQAIAAPLPVALSLADQKLQGLADFTDFRIALIVLTELGGDRLEDYRELLWHAFEVPIFEQLRDRDGTVLARECEVHDGLHVEPTRRLPHLLTASLIHHPCECGLETPRIAGSARTSVKLA
jgi:hypothetical protein